MPKIPVEAVQYVVYVGEDPQHRESYDDPDVYGPFAKKEEAEKFRKAMTYDFPGYEIKVLPLKPVK